MSFTNSTTNYNLPQYINTDIPSYLVDQNEAWETIDTNLKAVSDVANSGSATAGEALTAATEAQTTASGADVKSSAALSNQADAFSTSKTYQIGEYVTYNNIMYKCKREVTVAGQFNGADWDAVIVTDEISVLKDTLGDKESASAVSGYDAFSKINTLYGALASKFDNSAITFGQSFNRVRGSVFKFGKMVSIQISISTNTQYSSNWIQIGRLNTEYRPVTDVAFAISSSVRMTGRIQTDGYIFVYPVDTWVTSAHAYISATFITE